MHQNSETIEELRARLAGLTGPARVEPLSSLMQRLLHRMMTAPLESPSAKADLDEAIRCADEVHGHHREGDPRRPQIAALLGYLLCVHAAMSGATDQVSRAIQLLEEAIDHGRFAVSYLALLREMLAMQLIQRSQARLLDLGSRSPIDLLTGRRSPAAVPDLDRAEQLLRTVRETPGVSTDVSDSADVLLELCELVRGLLGFGGGIHDLSAMQNVFARFADLQKRLNADRAGIFGGIRDLLDSSAGIIDIPPEDRPVIIVEGSADESAEVPHEHAPTAAAPQPTQSDLLRCLMASLSLEADGQSAWNTAARLLLPDTDPPAVETVDHAIALASEVIESEDTELSEEDIALVHFVHATALCLRGRADPEGDGADHEYGAQALLSAVRVLPADHPEASVVLRSLGAFLAPERPLAGLDTLAAGFTGRFDTLLATGNVPADRRAELHALRCACRAAFATAELRRAVEELPPGYPWPASLKAAAEHPW